MTHANSRSQGQHIFTAFDTANDTGTNASAAVKTDTAPVATPNAAPVAVKGTTSEATPEAPLSIGKVTESEAAAPSNSAAVQDPVQNTNTSAIGSSAQAQGEVETAASPSGTVAQDFLPSVPAKDANAPEEHHLAPAAPVQPENPKVDQPQAEVPQVQQAESQSEDAQQDIVQLNIPAKTQDAPLPARPQASTVVPSSVTNPIENQIQNPTQPVRNERNLRLPSVEVLDKNVNRSRMGRSDMADLREKGFNDDDPDAALVWAANMTELRKHCFEAKGPPSMETLDFCRTLAHEAMSAAAKYYQNWMEATPDLAKYLQGKMTADSTTA